MVSLMASMYVANESARTRQWRIAVTKNGRQEIRNTPHTGDSSAAMVVLYFKLVCVCQCALSAVFPFFRYGAIIVWH